MLDHIIVGDGGVFELCGAGPAVAESADAASGAFSAKKRLFDENGDKADDEQGKNNPNATRMLAPMTYEHLFSIGASMRVALGIIFALFIICFIAIFIEETFLGGRRRRKALKSARERTSADSATAGPAPQNSNIPHPPQ